MIYVFCAVWLFPHLGIYLANSDAIIKRKRDKETKTKTKQIDRKIKTNRTPKPEQRISSNKIKWTIQFYFGGAWRLKWVFWEKQDISLLWCLTFCAVIRAVFSIVRLHLLAMMSSIMLPIRFNSRWRSENVCFIEISFSGWNGKSILKLKVIRIYMYLLVCDA